MTIPVASPEVIAWLRTQGARMAFHCAELLEQRASQPEPDGRVCAVCGDNDHQAFECTFTGEA